MSKKIYLSPERRPAPHGPYAVGGAYEHDVCNEIAALEKTALERYGFNVVIAPKSFTLKERVDWANANGIDYYQAIHSNGADGTATGTECLYFNHPDSIKANQLVYDELVKLYPSKRGCKDYTQFYENNMTKMVSCYPELAFHDNPADARFILDNKQQIAESLAKGVCAYFGVAWIPPSSVLYGVVGQKAALSSKDAADKYAAELNRQETSGWYWKVLPIEGTSLHGVMGQQIALSDRSRAETYAAQLNDQERAKPQAERWYWKVIEITQ